MAVHAHPVAEPMGEVLPVAGVGDDFPSRAVQLLTLRRERLARVDRRSLRVVHGIVDLLELV